jgi:hypothetical protein
MADQPDQHIYFKEKKEKWALQGEGNQKVTQYFDTQREAINRGKEILKNGGGGELNIHKKGGTPPPIREKNTYGRRDKFPPRG